MRTVVCKGADGLGESTLVGSGDSGATLTHETVSGVVPVLVEVCVSRIEVFADMVCPFTHVGLRRLSVARRGREHLRDVRVRAWPLEYLNGAPLASDLVGKEIDALREQIAPDLFIGFDAATFPRTSIPAFGLVAAAYAVDDLTGEVMSLALRDASSSEGRTSLTMTYSGRSDSRSASSPSPVRWPSRRYGPIGNGARREACKAHRTSSLMIAAGSVRAWTSAMKVGDSISRSPRKRCATSMPRRSASELLAWHRGPRSCSAAP